MIGDIFKISKMFFFFLPVLFHQVDNRDYFTNPFNNSVLLKKHLKMHLNFWNKQHECNISSIRKQCILKIQHFFSVKISIEGYKVKINSFNKSFRENKSRRNVFSPCNQTTTVFNSGSIRYKFLRTSENRFTF